MTREQQRKACEDARTLELHKELRRLVLWCRVRISGPYDPDATLILLECRVANIRQAVDRAGMQAISGVDTETWP